MSNEREPILTELTDGRDPRLAGLLSLYEASIPERERKPAAAIAEMATSTNHRVVVACDEDAVIGFSLLYLGQELALLEYLATAAPIRGQGLGARLYRAARAAAAALPLIVEVESDREPSADQLLRTRRIAFYRRLGCRRVSHFDFILPLEGTGPPPLLDLLVDQFAGPTVDRSTFAAWLSEIYVQVYACHPDDHRLSTMRAALPSAIPLV